MPKFDRAAFLKEAEAVVLRGLSKGYASGAKAMPVPGRPNAKYYEYTEGPWYLRDEYEVDPVSKQSVGRVRLEHTSDEFPHGRLVWFMVYGGHYLKEAIPCLKAALMANYTKGIFIAGRGAGGYYGDYQYTLVKTRGFRFDRFFAHESISHVVQRPAGQIGGSYFEDDGGHDVWGMALV